jgi:hypothetical protein
MVLVESDGTRHHTDAFQPGKGYTAGAVGGFDRAHNSRFARPMTLE